MFYSVNSYSSSSGRTGMSGLVSGMDTDEIVKGMTMGTTAKISKQLENKQYSVWKQEAYRGVTDTLLAFQQKYFVTDARENNIVNPGFFNNSQITTTSKYIKVSGTNRAAKDMQINNILNLAETARFSSSSSVSNTTISGGFASTEKVSSIAGVSIGFMIGSEDYAIALPDDFELPTTKKEDGTIDTEAQARYINDALNEALKTSTNTAGNVVDISDKISISVTGDSISIKGKAIVDAGGTPTGGFHNITVGSDPGNTILASLGIVSGATSTNGGTMASSGVDYSKMTKDVPIADISEKLSGKTLTFNLNGVTKNITFSASESADYDTPEKVSSYLQNKIDKTFGTGKVVSELDADGNLTFKTTSDMDILKISSADEGLLGDEGIIKIDSGASNRIAWNKSIKSLIEDGQFGTGLEPTEVPALDEDGEPILDAAGDPTTKNVYTLTINDVAIEIDETDDLNTMLNKITRSDAGVKLTYSNTGDKMTLTATDSGAVGKIKVEGNAFATALFGATGDIYDTDGVVGSDAKIEISLDGGNTFETLIRSSNSITIDGVTIDLLKTSEGVLVDDDLITFEVETDTDELVDKMQVFIEDYNAVIKSISDLMITKPDKDYMPLNDEQKADMTEDEIRKWDIAAKKGILHNDQYLSSILTDLRSSLYSNVDGVDGGLYSVGITTTTEWEKNGEIVMTPDGEVKFRQVLAENPQAIMDLFTTKVGDPYLKPLNEDGEPNEDYDPNDFKDSGLSYKLDVIFNRFSGSFGGDGILLVAAGKTGDSYGQDTLSEAIRDIDDNLERLKRTLEAEEDRYYKQFTEMEKYIQNMNSQSSWLTQQTAQ